MVIIMESVARHSHNSLCRSFQATAYAIASYCCTSIEIKIIKGKYLQRIKKAKWFLSNSPNNMTL